MTLIVGVVAGLLTFFYFVFKTYYYPVTLFIKYRVFRKKYNEPEFEEVYLDIQNGERWEKIYLGALLKYNSKRKAEEYKYMFNQINKRLKKDERRNKIAIKNGR